MALISAFAGGEGFNTAWQVRETVDCKNFWPPCAVDATKQLLRCCASVFRIQRAGQNLTPSWVLLVGIAVMPSCKKGSSILCLIF